MKKGFTLVELLGVIIILGILSTFVVINVTKWVSDKSGGIDEHTEELIYLAINNFLGRYDNFGMEKDNYCVSIGEMMDENYLDVTLESLGDYRYVYASYNGETTEYELLINSCKLSDVVKQQYVDQNTSRVIVKDEFGYYYYGTNSEVSNNWVWFAGNLWRIMGIDNDDNINLISALPISNFTLSDAIWESEDTYNNSFINTWLNSTGANGVFYKSLSNRDRNKILSSKYNIELLDSGVQITTTQKVGLLNEEQYVQAGGANSYLDIKNYFYLSNASSTSVRVVDNTGNVVDGDINLNLGVRPVIKISDIAVLSNYNGTKEDPYREDILSDNTTEIKVGEYINIPISNSTYCGSDKLCTFKVVSKDEDSIKVVLNGILPTTSLFGSSTSNIIFNSSFPIYTALNNFVTSIDDTNNNFRYIGNKTFYTSIYNNNYINIKNSSSANYSIYNGSFALPTIGEMYSANDIEIGGTGVYTIESSIENSGVSNQYWLINPSSSQVYTVSSIGSLNLSNSIESLGVRPVIYIKNNLSFKSGNGTLQNPYNLKRIEIGDEVYLNPGSVINQVKLSICNSYDLQQSETGVNSGCMKWNVIGIEGNKINLMLDHNVAVGVVWNSNNTVTSGPNTLLEVLRTKTSGWSNELLRTDSYGVYQSQGGANYTIDYTGYKARIIEANEVASIIGYEGFNDNTTSGTNWVYIDSLTQTRTVGQDKTVKTSKYGWLFSNSNNETSSCIYYGCYVDVSEPDVSNQGYWTSTSCSGTTNIVWRVHLGGALGNDYANNTSKGVRPVITVDYSLLHY